MLEDLTVELHAPLNLNGFTSRASAWQWVQRAVAPLILNSVQMLLSPWHRLVSC